MALVIEDGTGIANATSLLTFAEMRTFAEAHGFTVPDDDDALEIHSNNAILYMKSRRSEYDGERLVDDQALPFPRTGQVIDNVLIPDGVIPQEAKDFQAGIIAVLASGIDLFPTTSERALKRKKTGPLESEWFDSDTSPSVPILDALIEPLLGGSGGFALTVRRI